jgi:hypothetical protein
MCINAFIRLAGTSALAFETLAVGPTCGALSASYEPRCPLLLIRRSQEMGFSLREIADLLLGLFLAKPPRQGSRAGVQAVDLHTGRITGNGAVAQRYDIPQTAHRFERILSPRSTSRAPAAPLPSRSSSAMWERTRAIRAVASQR